MMKCMKQFGILLLISFFGEILHHLIPVPVPASIYGIIILLTGLKTKWIPLSAVKETGRFLVDIMPLMFIPAAVGLVDSWAVIQPSFVPYLIITAGSTCVVMGAAGKVTQSLLCRKEKKAKVGGTVHA